MRTFLHAAIALGLTCPALADWSDDPAQNTSVSLLEVDCVISHSAMTPGGMTWVAWYDADSGYSLRAQLLDPDGNTVLPEPAHAASQSLSYVQDFDLDSDADGNAVIAWADGADAHVAMVDQWGNSVYHKQFSGGGAFTANAQVCGTSTGRVIVGWGQDDDTRFKSLTPTGQSFWFSDVVLSGTGSMTLSDIKPGSDGDVIASVVSYTTFTGPKTLKAARITATGAVAWGPVDVFSTGSLQIGNYPEFIADDDDGAIFTWYTTSPLMARVQWLDAEGTRLLGLNGMAVTTETDMVHTGPTACHDPETDTATIFWARQNGTQSQSGVQVNRVNTDGDLLLGSEGLQMAAPDSLVSVLDLSARQIGDLAACTWIRQTNTLQGTVLARAVDQDGHTPWHLFGPSTLASGTAERSSLTAVSDGSQLIAVWSDDRDAYDRVYAQNINADGTLGPAAADCPEDVDGNGQVNVDDLLGLIGAFGTADSDYDFDGSGEVDTDDLLALLAAWGPCV